MLLNITDNQPTYHYNADVTNLETDNKGITCTTQASILFIFMLIERKTLYDSRVYSHNIPPTKLIKRRNLRNQLYAQRKEQENLGPSITGRGIRPVQ